MARFLHSESNILIKYSYKKKIDLKKVYLSKKNLRAQYGK